MLGDNTITNKNIPVQVLGIGGVGNLENITAVTAGNTHSVALFKNGNVCAWGFNQNHGSLGDGTTINKHLPVYVKNSAGNGNLTNIVQISAGSFTTFALTKAGNISAWGRNSSGEIGDNSIFDRFLPVYVKGVGNIGNLDNVGLAVGGGSHGLALKNDATVFSWGNNIDGQLGDGTYFPRLTPVQITVP